MSETVRMEYLRRMKELGDLRDDMCASRARDRALFAMIGLALGFAMGLTLGLL